MHALSNRYLSSTRVLLRVCLLSFLRLFFPTIALLSVSICESTACSFTSLVLLMTISFLLLLPHLLFFLLHSFFEVDTGMFLCGLNTSCGYLLSHCHNLCSSFSVQLSISLRALVEEWNSSLSCCLCLVFCVLSHPVIENGLSQCATLEHSALTAHFEQLAQQLSELKESVSHSAFFLPPYDQRQLLKVGHMVVET